MPGINSTNAVDTESVNQEYLRRAMSEQPRQPEIDYDRLARAVVDELERREVLRGERLLYTRHRV